MNKSRSLSIFLGSISCVFCNVAYGQGLSVGIEEAVRKFVRAEARYDARQAERAALYDLGAERVYTPPCHVYERLARRSVIAYMPSDRRMSIGLRAKKGGAAAEWNFALDATPDMLATNSAHCQSLSRWQGWGAILYREVTSSDGNQSSQDVVRDLDAERQLEERRRGGSSPVPSTSVIKLPKPEDYKNNK